MRILEVPFDFVYKSYDLSTKHQTQDIFSFKENTSSRISGDLRSSLPGPPESGKVFHIDPGAAGSIVKHLNAFREDLGVTFSESYGSYLTRVARRGPNSS